MSGMLWKEELGSLNTAVVVGLASRSREYFPKLIHWDTLEESIVIDIDLEGQLGVRQAAFNLP